MDFARVHGQAESYEGLCGEVQLCLPRRIFRHSYSIARAASSKVLPAGLFRQPWQLEGEGLFGRDAVEVRLLIEGRLARKQGYTKSLLVFTRTLIER